MSDKPSKRRCPVCEKAANASFVPFCSDRCKQIDLNRWLSDGYAIPGNQADDDSEGVDFETDMDFHGSADKSQVNQAEDEILTQRKTKH